MKPPGPADRKLRDAEVELRRQNQLWTSSEAAEWMVRLQDDPTVSIGDRHKFLAWLRQSPNNVAALLELRQLQGAFRLGGALDRAPMPERSPIGKYADPAADRIPASKRGEPAANPREGAAVLPPSDFVSTASWLRASVVTRVHSTENGALILCDPVPFFSIVRDLERDPRLVHQLHWRQWEEIVAAAYDREGFHVELTPRSGDGGRDVIATRTDIGTIRIFDQVKALSAGRVVTASDVFAMLGVISAEANVSKAFVTTTADFAPGIYKDPRLLHLMPYRLELRSQSSLLDWLSRIRKRCTR